MRAEIVVKVDNRELPKCAVEFLDRLRCLPSGVQPDSTVHLHLVETGHRMEFGCCARANSDRSEAA